MPAAVDVLAKYRGAAKAPPNDQGASREYVAFKASETPQRRLWLKRDSNSVDSYPSYSHLIEIKTDNFAVITLTYANPLVVSIIGEYLEELVQLLRNDLVDWVQLFDPKKHDRPEEGKPVVSVLEVHTHRPEPEPSPAEMH